MTVGWKRTSRDQPVPLGGAANRWNSRLPMNTRLQCREDHLLLASIFQVPSLHVCTAVLGKAWIAGQGWLRGALGSLSRTYWESPRHWSASFSLLVITESAWKNTYSCSQQFHSTQGLCGVILFNVLVLNFSPFERSAAICPKFNPSNKPVGISQAKGKCKDHWLQATCVIGLCLVFSELLTEALSLHPELTRLQQLRRQAWGWEGAPVCHQLLVRAPREASNLVVIASAAAVITVRHGSRFPQFNSQDKPKRWASLSVSFA